jgi:uncharacterized glyoxalase superfamily protein PhnB
MTRTRPAGDVIPALKYRDAPAAIAFLSRAFGFEERMAVPGPDGSVAHAELGAGTGVVMLGSRRPDPANPWAEREGIYVVVDDPDAHCARARAAGAEIVAEPEDKPYGSREYTARDPEGRLWSFGTYRPG